MKTWHAMYESARSVQNGREISPFIDAGSVAAAVLTDRGNIYVGVCIDSACSLGMCAERNAVANMITNGESKITRVLAVMKNGKLGSPCGSCREMLMQLHRDSRDIEILSDIETVKTVRLNELMPDWWGDEKF